MYPVSTKCIRNKYQIWILQIPDAYSVSTVCIMQVPGLFSVSTRNPILTRYIPDMYLVNKRWVPGKYSGHNRYNRALLCIGTVGCIKQIGLTVVFLKWNYLKDKMQMVTSVGYVDDVLILFYFIFSHHVYSVILVEINSEQQMFVFVSLCVLMLCSCQTDAVSVSLTCPVGVFMFISLLLVLQYNFFLWSVDTVHGSGICLSIVWTHTSILHNICVNVCICGCCCNVNIYCDVWSLKAYNWHFGEPFIISWYIRIFRCGQSVQLLVSVDLTSRFLLLARRSPVICFTGR